MEWRIDHSSFIPLHAQVEKLLSFAHQGDKDSGNLDLYNRGINYWNGEHEIKTRSKKLGNKAYNEFANVIETRMSHLTDAKPKWIFRPQETKDKLISSALNQIMGDYIWDYINWERGEDGGGKSEESVLQAMFAGSSHIKTTMDIYNGHPNFTVIRRGALKVDSKAKKKKELRFWIHLIPTSVKHIKRQYGVEVAAQADLERIYGQNKADFNNPQITAQYDATNEQIDNTPFLMKSDQTSKDFSQDFMGKAIIAECWMEDFTLEKIPYSKEETDDEFRRAQSGDTDNPVIAKTEDYHEKHIAAHQRDIKKLDPNTEAEAINTLQNHIDAHRRLMELFPETTRRKYPYGRVISICQGKLLRDDPNPFGDIGLDFRDVLIKWDWDINPEGYWGKPLTKDKFDPQDDLNHRKNSITVNINLLNQGIRKIKWILWDKVFKQNSNNLNNLPGNVIPFINSPDEFTTDFGTPMPAQVWGDMNWTQNFMKSQEATAAQGELPAPGTANATVETLLGEYKTVLRKPLRHYASALSEMAKNAVLIMAKYMDKNETFMILGDDQQTYEQIKWGSISDRAALLRNVRVDTTNMLPTSRLENDRKVLAYIQAGVPPEAAMLMLDDPRAIQIINSISQINQLGQALQQSEAQREQLQKMVDTLMNRMQGEGGQGNVGIFQ